MLDYLDDALFLVDNNYVSAREVLIACLKFMSDDDIRDMLEINELNARYSEDETDPSESDEWNSYDPDC